MTLSALLVPVLMLNPTPAAADAVCVNEPDKVLTEGRDPAEFIEVEPGVFLLEEAVKNGIDFTRDEPKHEAVETPAGRALKAPAPRVCYNSRCDTQNDQTQNNTLFGGNPAWGATTCANSYYYNSGGFLYDYDWVSFSAYTQTPINVAINYTYATLYVNGAYVGYVYNYGTNINWSSVGGFLYAACPYGGTLVAEMQHYHYASQGFETLYIGDRVAAKVACCP